MSDELYVLIFFFFFLLVEVDVFSNELFTSRLTFTFRQSLLILSSCPLALSPHSPPSAVTLVKIMEKNSPFTADFLLQGQASEEFHTQKVFFYSYFAIFFSQISSCSTAVVAYLPVVLATNDKKKKQQRLKSFVCLILSTLLSNNSWSSHSHPVTPPD